MAYCATCNVEVAGKFCTHCGGETVSQAVTIEAPVIVQQAAVGAQHISTRGPGYAVPVAGAPVQSMGSTADNRFTHDAEFLLRSTGERIAWQGKPSIYCLVPRAVIWAAVILIALIASIGLGHGGGWVLFWILAAAVNVGAGYLNWKHTTYRITSQRIEYSSGVFSATTAAKPLSHIGNVTILRPFPWNLMKLGHLELDIPDETQRARNGVVSRVRLKYLENLETTRDLIHSSSAIGNQLWDQHRYGR